MKRLKLLIYLLRNGCVLVREGSKHSIYRNLSNGAQTTIPRHKVLLITTARGICKQLGLPWPPK